MNIKVVFLIIVLLMVNRISAQDEVITTENVGELEILHTIEFEEPVTSVRFYPETNMVINSGTSLFIYDLTALNEPPDKIILQDAKAVITAFDVHPDGKILAAGDAEGQIFIWDLEQRELVEVLSDLSSIIHDVDFSSDGEKLVATDDTGVHLWDVETLELIAEYQQFVSPFRVAFSPDSSLLAVTGRGLSVIQAISGEPVFSNPHVDSTDVVFSLNGDEVLFTTGLRGVGIVNLENSTGTYLSPGKFYSPSTAISLHPDGALVISGNYEGETYIWQISPADIIFISPKMDVSVNDVRFNLDGTLFAVAYTNRIVQLWGTPANLSQSR
jgi:WD40 repeat protein